MANTEFEELVKFDPDRSGVAIKNVPLLWKNFSGAKGVYNNEGNRNFNIELTPEIAKQLKDYGFNIKERVPNDPELPTRLTMKVNVRYHEDNPELDPKIYIHGSHGRRLLTSENVAILDSPREFSIGDISFNAYHNKDREGNPTVTAYLRILHVEMDEDPFEDAYQDEPDSFGNTMTFAAVKSIED